MCIRDRISTADAAVLLDAVREGLENETYKFYVGTSYRHLLIWDKGEVVELTQPHDVLGQTIGQYLPEDAVPVSYTHLDVYKRQHSRCTERMPMVI